MKATTQSQSTRARNTHFYVEMVRTKQHHEDAAKTAKKRAYEAAERDMLQTAADEHQRAYRHHAIAGEIGWLILRYKALTQGGEQ